MLAVTPFPPPRHRLLTFGLRPTVQNPELMTEQQNVFPLWFDQGRTLGNAAPNETCKGEDIWNTSPRVELKFQGWGTSPSPPPHEENPGSAAKGEGPAQRTLCCLMKTNLAVVSRIHQFILVIFLPPQNFRIDLAPTPQWNFTQTAISLSHSLICARTLLIFLKPLVKRRVGKHPTTPTSRNISQHGIQLSTADNAFQYPTHLLLELSPTPTSLQQQCWTQGGPCKTVLCFETHPLQLRNFTVPAVMKLKREATAKQTPL